MTKICGVLLAALLFFSGLGLQPSYAQVAVYDIPAITNSQMQFVQELAKWMEQLEAMEKQYNQLMQTANTVKRTYDSVTGIRSVGGLFRAMSDRALYNSLPDEARDIVNNASGVLGNFSAFNGRMQNLQFSVSQLKSGNFVGTSNAMLWQQQVNRIAGQQAASELLYNDASQRVITINKLVDQAATTKDTQETAVLQARIAGEQALLANLQVKVAALDLNMRARADQERLRSEEIAHQMDSRPPPKPVYSSGNMPF